MQDVLHGDYVPSTLTLEELGWKDGIPFTVNYSSWAKPGDRMLLGLVITDNGMTSAGPRFILTSSATRFYLHDDGSVTGNYIDTDEDTRFVDEMTALTVEQLLQRVR